MPGSKVKRPWATPVLTTQSLEASPDLEFYFSGVKIANGEAM